MHYAKDDSSIITLLLDHDHVIIITWCCYVDDISRVDYWIYNYEKYSYHAWSLSIMQKHYEHLTINYDVRYGKIRGIMITSTAKIFTNMD